MKIRASIGTAAALGLEKIRVLVKSTTAYLMLYSESHCQSNCMFCSQARDSQGNTNQLSRVLWPVYDLSELIERFETIDSGIKRICIQTVRFENSTTDLMNILTMLSKSSITIPLTVCSYPVNTIEFEAMKTLGVKRVGISFDCATPELFDEIKGSKRGVDISWQTLEKAMVDAMEVFGNRFVSTHLIIGLGETEQQAVNFLQRFYDKKVTVGLFAFTAVRGTDLEKLPQPEMASYRRIQLARYLIFKGTSSFSNMAFSEEGTIIDFGTPSVEIKNALVSGTPFKTSGCPHCNRPFYNESPGKELYNFPRDLNSQELSEVEQYFTKFLN
ncbi:MAG: radical SAM protein [Candidatus Heimdallarchaeota archaeon]